MSDTHGTARILQLQTGQPGPAVFMIPGFGGSAGRLTLLAASLATPMPVFAIEGRGVDGSALPDSVVEVMAEHYIELIKTLQDSGPYSLIGHSFGGLVVLEIARQLIGAGDKIACLILLDSNFSNPFWPWRYYARILASRARRRLKELCATTSETRGVFVRSMLDLFLRKIGARDVARVTADDIMTAHEIAFAQYNPGSYPGKLVFFRATQQDYPADPEALWRSRVRELEVHWANGGHLSMLDPPNATSLAADISACLAAASAGR